METGKKLDNDSLRYLVKKLSRDELTLLRKKLSLRMKSGSALVAEALHRCGIKRVIGIPGTPVDQIFIECSIQGIRLIGARHQQSAVMAAASANYISGRLDSAIVVSAGPGVANTLTGLLVAKDNSWPVVVIGGRSPLYNEGSGYFQELDAATLLTPVTKEAIKIKNTSDILKVIIKAFETASTGRPGPVYIDIPQDVLGGMSVVDDSLQPRITPNPGAEMRLVADAARIIRAGKRPLMIIGEDIRWSFSAKDLKRITDEFGMPFISSSLGRGFLPDDHPLCANDARRWIQSQADVVLMAGAWFDWRFRFGAELGPETDVIHVDINPLTLGKNIDPILKIQADSGIFLSQFVDALAQSFRNTPGVSLEDWHSIIKNHCQENREKRMRQLSGNPGSNSFYMLYKTVQDFLPEKHIVVLDGGINLAMGQLLLNSNEPCSWLDPGRNGCMGTGIPFGIGAKLAAPDHLVVVICGDYSFGLSAMELETAVRHAIPVIFIVANNNGINGELRQKRYLSDDYPERFSQYQPSLRYEQIMKVFNGHAEWVDELGKLRPALDRSLASGLPACINVCIDPNTPHPGNW